MADMEEDQYDESYREFPQETGLFRRTYAAADAEDDGGDEEEEEDEDETEDDGDSVEYIPAAEEGGSPAVDVAGDGADDSASDQARFGGEGGEKPRDGRLGGGGGGGEGCSPDRFGAGGDNPEASQWNRGEIDGLFCPICMEAWTDDGEHHMWSVFLFYILTALSSLSELNHLKKAPFLSCHRRYVAVGVMGLRHFYKLFALIKKCNFWDWDCLHC